MGRRAHLQPPEEQRIRKLHGEGYSIIEIAKTLDRGRNTVAGVISGKRNGQEAITVARDRKLEGPVPTDQLNTEAARSLTDIGLFAYRYFGLVLMPYQEEATEIVTQRLRSPEEEYLVINQAPGTGKSTFFTLVLPAWVTCQDRTIRGLLGSASKTTVEMYNTRLRVALTRRQPVKAKPRDLELGIAVDAQATLVEDFGRFRPYTGSEVAWRADAFTVLQHDDIDLSEKEPTWSAFSRESSFIGLRPDIAIWDDVYDPRKMRTAEARAELKDWWTEYAETRLEPGGLLILQGQRLGPDDIYRYALNQSAGEDEFADEELPADDEERPRKYHHIVFKAHYEDRCRGAETHGREAPAYPEGCLLYPKRLPWRKLRAVRANSADKYEIVYQQGDVDPASVLVPAAWISGGIDPDTREQLIGCWDNDRGLCELPRDSAGNINLVGPLLSVATADPSPTKFWAIEWWVVDLASKQQFLMDLERRRMEAPDFLDRLWPSGDYVGIMESWQNRSRELGVPIRWWVVEQNAAQRFMLQYQHTRDWQRDRSVVIIPHDTYGNKSDPKLGVETIAPEYHFGRVRLPGRGQAARIASLKLIDEVTHYPEWPTDDCVLAQWFLRWNMPQLARSSRRVEPIVLSTPSWLGRSA